MNDIIRHLMDSGIVTEDSLKVYSSQIRESTGTDIEVLRCEKSGVIVLNNLGSTEEQVGDLTYWGTSNIEEAKISCLRDELMRKEMLIEIVTNKKWMDFGTGLGGVLDLMSPFCRDIHCIEINPCCIEDLKVRSYRVSDNVGCLPNDHFDVVTMFHSFEHLLEPIDTLRQIREKMVVGGKLVVEVPHARDFLLSFLELESFKKFTLWKEHRILHTRESLIEFIKAAGFNNIIVQGKQRYPLSNHLHWLQHNQPNGHVKWNFLNTEEILRVYENLLISLDRTDTIVAFAEK